MIAWYIDAIDVRAGLAQATFRENDLCRIQGLDAASSTGGRLTGGVALGSVAFFAPPAFVPEFVAGRSVGFALTRHRAQAGLFFQGNELAFDSLAAVAEFVRRVYLSGGGGDGTDENGGVSPLPSPEGETGPSETRLTGLEGGGATDPVHALLDFSEGCFKIAHHTKDGTSAPPPPPPRFLASAGTGTQARGRRLVRGALRVLREINRRRPQITSLPEVLRWLTMLDHFAGVATQMGLWSLFRYEFSDAQTLRPWLYTPRPGKQRDAIDVIIDEFPFDPYKRVHLYPGYMPVLWGESVRSDPFELLALFPVPPQLVPGEARMSDNLQALLSKFSSAPLGILQTNETKPSEEVAELVLFGAACLGLGAERCPIFWGLEQQICQQFLDGLADLSLTWLASNLPRLVYSIGVESLIAKASTVPA